MNTSANIPYSLHIFKQDFAEEVVGILHGGCYITQTDAAPLWVHCVPLQHGNVGTDPLSSTMCLSILQTQQTDDYFSFGLFHNMIQSIPNTNYNNIFERILHLNMHELFWKWSINISILWSI